MAGSNEHCLAIISVGRRLERVRAGLLGNIGAIHSHG